MEEARADIKELNIHSKDKPDDKSLPNVPKPPPVRLINEDVPLGIGIRKENLTMNHIAETIESSWLKFVNSFKKHLSMMIIFMLIGGAGGLYIAKAIYDFRMKEITMIGGFVHDKRVYDVKLRP